MGNPIYMTREELAIKNAKLFGGIGYHPGYLTQNSINNINTQHESEVKGLRDKIKLLEEKVAELERTIADMEINNSPTMLI